MQEPRLVRFMVDAEASPAILPRLLQTFARRNLMPERMWSECAGSNMAIEIAILAIAPDVIHGVEGNLRGVVGVRQVSWISAAQDSISCSATWS